MGSSTRRPRCICGSRTCGVSGAAMSCGTYYPRRFITETPADDDNATILAQPARKGFADNRMRYFLARGREGLALVGGQPLGCRAGGRISIRCVVAAVAGSHRRNRPFDERDGLRPLERTPQDVRS